MSDGLLNVAANGYDTVKKAVDESATKKEKALSSVIKIESFRLSQGLKRGIRSAQPGGSDLKKLTAIARLKKGRFRSNLPFRGVVNSVRYDFDRLKNVAHIGWTSKTNSGLKRLMTRYQRGFETPVTEKKRKALTMLGMSLGKRSSLRKYFFIRKTTTKFDIPERPIVDPFYEKEKEAIRQNIARNFRLKMMGKRI